MLIILAFCNLGTSIFIPLISKSSVGITVLLSLVLELDLVRVISKNWKNSNYIFEFLGSFEKDKLIEYVPTFTDLVSFAELKEYSIENYTK